MMDTQQTLAELDSVRDCIAAKQEELKDLPALPAPADEALARADAMVDHLAAKVSTAEIVNCITNPTHGSFELERLIREHGAVVATAFIDPTGFKRRLHGILKAHPIDNPGPPLAQRQGIKRQLEKALFDLETREEQIIVALEAAGVEVFRRADADPAIVLNAA